MTNRDLSEFNMPGRSWLIIGASPDQFRNRWQALDLKPGAAVHIRSLADLDRHNLREWNISFNNDQDDLPDIDAIREYIRENI